MSERTEERIRHIAYSHSDGSGFGDHYITQDKSLKTADQFDVTVFPRGDHNLPAGQMLRDIPHIRIRTWDGDGWHIASVTLIARAELAADVVSTPGKRVPVDQELFNRSAPRWNCVDFPNDGPHYLAHDGGCRWCGMTKQEISAEHTNSSTEARA